MNQLFAVDILRSLILEALMLSGPILATAIAVGVSISLVQSVTSIQEQTLSFVPKLIAAAGVFIATAHWMLGSLIDFSTQVISLMSDMAP